MQTIEIFTAESRARIAAAHIIAAADSEGASLADLTHYTLTESDCQWIANLPAGLAVDPRLVQEVLASGIYAPAPRWFDLGEGSSLRFSGSELAKADFDDEGKRAVAKAELLAEISGSVVVHWEPSETTARVVAFFAWR